MKLADQQWAISHQFVGPTAPKAVPLPPSQLPRQGQVRTRTTTVVLTLACVAACGAGPHSRNKADTSVDSTRPASAHIKPSGPVRTDLDPLSRRFPDLGAPVTASWQAGILGDVRVPGPSSYWIDAIVTLKPEAARDLRRRGSLEPAAAPEITEDLRKALSPGPWLAGTELDRVVSGSRGGYHSRTFMAKDADVIVLIAEGA